MVLFLSLFFNWSVWSYTDPSPFFVSIRFVCIFTQHQVVQIQSVIDTEPDLLKVYKIILFPSLYHSNFDPGLPILWHPVSTSHTLPTPRRPSMYLPVCSVDEEGWMIRSRNFYVSSTVNRGKCETCWIILPASFLMSHNWEYRSRISPHFLFTVAVRRFSSWLLLLDFDLLRLTNGGRGPTWELSSVSKRHPKLSVIVRWFC